MGAEQSIYLGPYMKVRHIDGEKKFSKTICSDENCPKHKIGKDKKGLNSKFCPNCGSPTKSLPFSEPAKISCGNFLFDKFEDRLCIAHSCCTSIFVDCEILLPNTRDMPEYIEVQENCTQLTDLSRCKYIMDEQIKWFMEKYDEEITAMSKRKHKIKIEWGLVIHYS